MLRRALRTRSRCSRSASRRRWPLRGRTRPAAEAARCTGADVRRQRPRLGARRRHEPVGRLRLRAARLDVRPDPRPLLPRHDARARRRSRACACCSARGTKRARGLVGLAVPVRDALGRPCTSSPAGPYALGPALRVTVDRRSPRRRSPGRSLFLPGATPLQLARQARTAARSQVDRRNGRSCSVVNVVGLEPYLYGVVPQEMPSAWPAEALKAQAVVARSYALAVAQDRRRVRPLRRHAQPGLRRHRRREAVDDRRGRGDGRPGRALRGQGRDDVLLLDLRRTHRVDRRTSWARGEPVPYLVSVADPYDTRLAAPRLGPVRRSPRPKLRSTFKVPGQLLDVRVAVNASQRVDGDDARRVEGRGRRAGRRSSARSSACARRGSASACSRSTPPAAPVEYGGTVDARRASHAAARSATLEQRASGGSWEPVGAHHARRRRRGRRDRVKPLVSTDYRIAAPATLVGAPVHVPVAPRVRLQPATAADDARGPRPAGRPRRARRRPAPRRRRAGGRLRRRRSTTTGAFAATPEPDAGHVPRARRARARVRRRASRRRCRSSRGEAPRRSPRSSRRCSCPRPAQAARYAVGVEPGASLDASPPPSSAPTGARRSTLAPDARALVVETRPPGGSRARPRRRLRRAARRLAPARVRAERPARAEAVAPRAGPRVRLLAASCRRSPVRASRSSTPASTATTPSSRAGSPPRGASSAAAALDRPAGPRHVRRGPDRGATNNAIGHRRASRSGRSCSSPRSSRRPA